MEPVKVVRSETRGGQAATGPAEVIQQFLHQVPAPPAFQAHAYALVASAALETRQGSQADRLLTALRQRHWRDVASIRQWLGDRDNVEVYIVLSHDDQTAVLALLSPAEPFGSPSLVDCEYLTTDVASEIEEVFQPSWQPLPGKQIGVVETKSLARPVEAALSARRYLRPLPPEFAVVE